MNMRIVWGVFSLWLLHVIVYDVECVRARVRVCLRYHSIVDGRFLFIFSFRLFAARIAFAKPTSPCVLVCAVSPVCVRACMCVCVCDTAE